MAVAVDRGSRAARPVGVAAVAHDQLDARLDAVDGVTVAVAVRLYGCRLDLDRLPPFVHQQILGYGLGVPRLGEHRFHCLGVVLLLSVHDLAGQRHHDVVAVVPVCREAVLRQLTLHGEELCIFFATASGRRPGGCSGRT